MLPLYVVLALVTVGFVGPCLLDVATTPQRFFDLPTKQMWLIVIVAFWAFGAAAWLMAGRGEVQARRNWDNEVDRWVARQAHAAGPGYPPGSGAGSGRPIAPSRRVRQAAANQTRFVAPDDNPEFLLELEQRIRDWREDV